MPKITDDDAHLLFRRIIQKVATGPEMSKDISLDDSYQAMSYILSGAADPIQVAIYLIAAGRRAGGYFLELIFADR